MLALVACIPFIHFFMGLGLATGAFPDTNSDADAHRRADGKDRRFANTKQGRQSLVRWTKGAYVAFEPSGLYHRALERHLAAAGIGHGLEVYDSARVAPERSDIEVVFRGGTPRFCSGCASSVSPARTCRKFAIMSRTNS